MFLIADLLHNFLLLFPMGHDSVVWRLAHLILRRNVCGKAFFLVRENCYVDSIRILIVVLRNYYRTVVDQLSKAEPLFI